VDLDQGAAEEGQALGRKGLRELASLVTPETILRWYRELIARKYDGTAKRGPGRPRKAGNFAELVQRMARENPRWGYTRIMGAMKNLGHEVGRNTVKRMLAEAGIRPRQTGVEARRGRRSCAPIGKTSPPRTSSRWRCSHSTA
jgi:transposase